MKIGVFGGTFNPVHKGHMLLTEYCKTSVNLDRIILIPTFTPPHKECQNLASSEHRFNMCKLACRNYSDYEVSDIEIKRQGKSYTCDTLTSLKQIYPNDELYLIMGADMFLTLNNWKNPEIIFENAKIITLPRDNSDSVILNAFYESTLKKMGAFAVILPDSVMSVSSTVVRDNIDNYDYVSSLVDNKVYEYISENKLYRK